MNFFVTNFRWLMLVSGLLTCTMFLALVSPQTSLESNFGQSLSGPVVDVVVRNWGALIGMNGVMLVYGAFVENVRRFVLVISTITKIIFMTLVLTFGRQFLDFGAGTAVVADAVMVVLFVVYLIVGRSPVR